MATTFRSDAPPVDLDDFRRRARRIYDERIAAREDYERQGLLEADADHHYRVEKAHRLDALRAEGKGQAEALALAEGDAVVADHKRTRDHAGTLKRTAQMRVDEMERNAASLRTEASMSEGL